MTITIYHYPKCSKSRATLALLEERGIAPEIVLYRETPPTVEELKIILKRLGLPPRKILRKGEDAYKELGLADENISPDDLIIAMTENPALIERPIVVNGVRAAIGRPPEAVLEILD